MLLALLPSFVAFPAYAVTINTAQINGKYYPLTGALNNPAVGVAVEMSGALLAKANPWLAGMGLALSVYKIAEELFPGQVVAFRPGLVSEKVDSWPGNNPPSTMSASYEYSVCSGIIAGAPHIWASSLTAAGASCFTYLKTALPSYTWSADTPVVNATAACQGGSSLYGRVAYYATNNGSPVYCGNAARQTSTSCPSGYIYSGGACNLTNAAAVKYPSDGIPTFISDGQGHFISDPRDPDLPTGDLSGIPGQSSVTQKSSDGKQTSTTTQNTDGSITHQTTNEYYDSTDASTHLFTQKVTINNQGAVTSYSTTNNPVTVVNGQTQNVPTNFPDDYNREVTQQEIKTAITTDISDANSVKTSLGTGPEGPKYDPLDLHIPDRTSFQVAPTAPLEGLFPTNSGGCVTLPVNLPYLSGLILDPCEVVTAARPIIDWGVMMLGLLAGVFVWFGKAGEE